MVNSITKFRFTQVASRLGRPLRCGARRSHRGWDGERTEIRWCLFRVPILFLSLAIFGVPSVQAQRGPSYERSAAPYLPQSPEISGQSHWAAPKPLVSQPSVPNVIQENSFPPSLAPYRIFPPAAEPANFPPLNQTPSQPEGFHQAKPLFAPAGFRSPPSDMPVHFAGVSGDHELPLSPRPIEHDIHNDFSPLLILPDAAVYNPKAELDVYNQRYDVPTQRPLFEWPRKLFDTGMVAPAGTWLGETNLVQPLFTIYGDFRTGVAAGRNASGRIDNWAVRLNLDFDFWITATERFHAFVGPLHRGGDFTRFQLTDNNLEWESVNNLNPVTGFFEGDFGAILGGMDGTPSPFELPFAFGLVPLLFQNGIWMEDAVAGGIFAFPGKHSTVLNWSNFDLAGFAIIDQLNSPAFGKDKNAGQALGVAAHIDAYHGYIETGYAYLHDRRDLGRSYHNFAIGYSRRYLDRFNNGLRLIINSGQRLPAADRTADGGLFIFESSYITKKSFTVLPYFNMFFGWDRPQSVARAGGSGGILRNIGINFDTDGLNGYPTLDATANDTFGGAVGIDLIGDGLDRQLILELAYVSTHGHDPNRNAPGDQAAIGGRYQHPVSHATLLRFDAMYGWRRAAEDIYGVRAEYRWKF